MIIIVAVMTSPQVATGQAGMSSGLLVTGAATPTPAAARSHTQTPANTDGSKGTSAYEIYTKL